ncbi:MAG: hypothetical protein QOF77_169 [Solirubrobacteraceae bacterium]|jgi:hypothetical protein|nr:hypothetical protein [Solirubrobacteraceae bacterium]
MTGTTTTNTKTPDPVLPAEMPAYCDRRAAEHTTGGSFERVLTKPSTDTSRPASAGRS